MKDKRRPERFTGDCLMAVLVLRNLNFFLRDLQWIDSMDLTLTSDMPEYFIDGLKI